MIYKDSSFVKATSEKDGRGKRAVEMTITFSLNSRWYLYVEERFRASFLSILDYLAGGEFPLVMVGSSVLLIYGYHQRRYLWDLDLLFKDDASLKEFQAKSLPTDRFEIALVDENGQGSETLVSVHSAWRKAGSGWVNVDLISRRDLDWYSFHKGAMAELGAPRQEINVSGRPYTIGGVQAHPWGIFVEKAFSPRIQTAIQLGNVFSYDARDLFTIIQADGARPSFHRFLAGFAARQLSAKRLKQALATVIAEKEKLGYGYLEVPAGLMKTIEKLPSEARG